MALHGVRRLKSANCLPCSMRNTPSKPADPQAMGSGASMGRWRTKTIGGAAATSRKSEMKLTNVARASLNDELLKDYKSFLLQRSLRVWHKDSPEALAMRERLKHDTAPNLPPAQPGKVRLTGLAGLSDFVGKAEPELAANAMLCAVNQAAYLLKRQLESQSREFLEKGGFTENPHAARVEKRRSDKPAGSRTPFSG